jgi:plastocyanin
VIAARPVLRGGILTLGILTLSSGPASAAGNTQRVAMKAVAYLPRQVTVHVGDAIEWANEDIVAHTATAKDKSWEMNVLPGRSARMVMSSAGSFSYFCRYHPNMTGEVVVEP